MRYIIIVCSVFILFAPVSAQSQTDCKHRLSGVLYGKNNQALGDVLVYLAEKNKTTHTNARGEFSFLELCQGSYTLQFFYEDYHLRNLSAQAPLETPIIVYLDSLNTALEDVHIHGKYDADIAPTHALSRQIYSQSAGRQLGDMLTEVPGVQAIQTGSGIFKPVVHGLYGQRLLILNQGARQESQSWGMDHAPEIDPFSGSQIEVMKGAAALRYGAEVMGGAALIRAEPLPFNAKTEIGGSILLNGQSNGRSGAASAMLEGSAWNKWAWRAQSTLKRGGDFHTPNYSLTNTGIREFDVSAQIGRHADTWGAELWFSSFKTAIGILKGISISNLNDLETAMSRVPPLYTSSFDYQIGEPRQEVTHRLLKWNLHKDIQKGKISLQYAFQTDDRQEYDLRFSSLINRPVMNLTLQTHTLDIFYEKRVTDKLLTAVGNNSMLQRNQNIAGTFRIPFIPDYDQWSSGLYAMIKYTNRRYAWDVAARYDMRDLSAVGFDYQNKLYRRQLFFHHGSASAGMKYAGDKNLFSWNLLYTWRPPHVYELFSLGLHQSVAAVEYGLLLDEKTTEITDTKTANYKNETSFKAMFSWQHTRRRWTFSADWHVNLMNNYIYLNPEGITRNARGFFPYLRQRQTDALFYGADISAQYQLTPALKAIANLTFLQTKNLHSPSRLTYIPANKFDARLRWEKQHKRHRYAAEARGKYKFRQYQAPRVISIAQWREAFEKEENLLASDPASFDFMPAPNGYFLGEIYLEYAVQTDYGKYEIQLSCRNIFDAAYKEYANRLRYYAEEPGRNAGILLKYSF